MSLLRDPLLTIDQASQDQQPDPPGERELARKSSRHISPTVGPHFTQPDGLRLLLQRLHRAGPGAWRHDSEAAELMRFAAERYGALARKYGQEPTDAAAAAFEAMLNPSTRTADDPWAVVTVAVRITLIAENRANGMLTSTERARRAEYSVFHDAERFSDRDVELTEYDPAFQVEAAESPADNRAFDNLAEVGQVAQLLVRLGWPADTARSGVDHVCARLAEIGSRQTAYERLRRDKALRAQLDLNQESWVGLLRILLGHTARSGILRQGLLARLLSGDTPADLLADPATVRAVESARPAW